LIDPFALNTYSPNLFSIYGLTKSRWQYYSVISLSGIAFALGMVTDVMSWKTLLYGCFHQAFTPLLTMPAVSDCATKFIDRLARYSGRGRVPYHLYAVPIMIVS